MMRRLSLAAAAVALVLLGPAGAAPSAPPDQVGNNPDTFKALNLFAEAFERVRRDYVEPVNDEQLVESAINGMLTALDPHSAYLNAKAYQEMQVQTSGEFGGLGVEVAADNGLIRIVAPIDDTPGARAGLKPGDLIVAIDGQSVLNLSLQEAVEKMRGAPNTQIKLSIRRGADHPFDVTLTRAIIHVQAVRSHLERNNLAYIRLASFSENAATEIISNYEKLKTQAGGKLAGLVLDLRSNPGGLLQQAVDVSDAFLERGEIVSTRGRRPEDVTRYNAHPGDITGGLPIVVLIDGGTASASEIVSGALQDHHRAVIMGTRSFGKGSVQTVIPMPGHTAMKLTTARYFTPSGRSIQAKGIDPDIVVEPAKIEKLNQGDRIHEADLKGALPNPDQAAAPPAKAAPAKPGTPAATPTPSDGQTDAQPATPADPNKPSPDDYQLNRALDLLQGIALYNSKPTN